MMCYYLNVHFQGQRVKVKSGAGNVCTSVCVGCRLCLCWRMLFRVSESVQTQICSLSVFSSRASFVVTKEACCISRNFSCLYFPANADRNDSS